MNIVSYHNIVSYNKHTIILSYIFSLIFYSLRFSYFYNNIFLLYFSSVAINYYLIVYMMQLKNIYQNVNVKVVHAVTDKSDPVIWNNFQVVDPIKELLKDVGCWLA